MIRRTWLQMGMPVTVCIQDDEANDEDVAAVASWFEDVNQRFSPYLESSEVSRLDAGSIGRDELSDQFTAVLRPASRQRLRRAVTSMSSEMAGSILQVL